MNTEIYKALSDESRLRLLNLLFKRELCVCELENILNMSQTNVSRHLNKLKNANIVTMKKESKWAYYSINEHFIKNNENLIKHLKSSFMEDKDLAHDMNILISFEEKQALCSDSNIV